MNRADLVYEVITRDCSVGRRIPHEEFERELPDFRENRVALYAAIRRLEREEKRTLINVRGVGYEIAPAAGHVAVAKKRERRAQRQIEKGRHTVLNTRLDELSAEQKRQNEAMSRRQDIHLDMLRRQERRQDRLEEAQRQDRRTAKETTAELSEQVDILRRGIEGLASSMRRMGFGELVLAPAVRAEES